MMTKALVQDMKPVCSNVQNKERVQQKVPAVRDAACPSQSPLRQELKLANRLSDEPTRPDMLQFSRQPISVQFKAEAGPTQDDLDKLNPTGPSGPESSTEEELQEEGQNVQAKTQDGRAATNVGKVPDGSRGRPIAHSMRGFMERGFGRDFSKVRLHTDSPAHQFVVSANALAATSGTNVYSRSDVTLESKPWLLAHELAHVVQQGKAPSLDDRARHAPFISGNTASVQRGEYEADKAADAITAGSAGVGTVLSQTKTREPQFYQGTICGRPSTQFPDFPSTYISHIEVDLTSPDHDVTLTWAGPSASLGETGPFHSSPGAGQCARDCDNTADSQTTGSMCTPKGSRNVERFACALGGHPTATNATYFHSARGIAFHYYRSVPNYPASHGCVRLGLHAAQLIFDSARKNVTTVNVAGTWTRGTVRGRPKCY